MLFTVNLISDTQISMTSPVAVRIFTLSQIFISLCNQFLSYDGEEKQNSLSYIYDARYHVHPYMLSTTVLSDVAVYSALKQNQSTTYIYLLAMRRLDHWNESLRGLNNPRGRLRMMQLVTEAFHFSSRPTRVFKPRRDKFSDLTGLEFMLGCAGKAA